MNNTNQMLDLEIYLKTQYNYQFVDMEDLLKQPFIEYEGIGANSLLWIKINGEKYLFKEFAGYEWLGEIISEKIANHLGIPCAEYTICKLKNKYGILSKKFTKKNETIILGAQIIQEVLDKYPYLKEKNGKILDDEKFQNYIIFHQI